MRYFRLLDDMQIQGRWHLGEVLHGDVEVVDLLDGRALVAAGGLSCELVRSGVVLEWSYTSFAVPVVSRRLAGVLNAWAGRDLECIPVEIAGQSGMFVLNVLRVVECLDETRSAFVKWTERDHRADLAGSYRQVSKIVLAGGRIPPDAHLFRIRGWCVGLVVSEVMKEEMARAGCRGAVFKELQVSRDVLN